MMSRARITCLTAFLAAIALPAAAQNPAPATPAPTQRPAAAAPAPLEFPTFEVTYAYQLLHRPDNTYPFGLNVDGAWNRSKAFGLAGEIGWAINSEDDVTHNFWHFGVGPRFNARTAGKVSPFGQLLVGSAYLHQNVEINGVDDTDSTFRFMLQPGVGVNVIAGDGWGIVGQVDYRRVFLDKGDDGESGENEFRVLVGVRLLLD